MSMHRLLTLTVLLAITACSPQKPHPLQSKQAASGDWTLPYGEWSFSFITPWKLRAEVTHARIIDTDGYLYTFNTLDQTARGPDSINKWASSVHGPSIIFNKVKKPPQYIVFCWDSYADKKTYETSAMFGPETWLRMKTPADHTWNGHAVWYSNILFGLSPGGKVKVWFPDVAGRPSLPVKPLKMRTRSGSDLNICKDYNTPAESYDGIQSIEDLNKGKTYPYGNWD
ncbi:DUF2931 family protein [Salmonella enterica]|uniref:DUF2931 family protein n=1 Tax=Salmonella enterica subsp. VII serovar 40:z4,z24:[z39] TaxID=1967625 RepID=A0A731TFU6_SALEE|nr:DUF2931 family protein [Salmonella enterica]EBH8101423.1 DUF2931 family protein [Salmonella enterica subsp. houtenae serovar O:11:g,z25:-]EDO5295764.1 DUF2931 family protein [Salmonella enterica subsp. houtenae serovar 40:z4,z24:-]EDU0971503.1 DUF2931 family protein [Salmonella enterica subsp. arizonae serovar 38:z4,z23:-]EEJ1556311.1 DUF2931 family protein [Salmonella enterica subsp. houtenae]QJY67902.1 DUF2931 family protein [Salmonella enterica subsp. VII serovar 1,40:g,z51:--]QUZ24166.